MANLKDSLNQLYSLLGTNPSAVDDHQRQVAEIQQVTKQIELLRAQDVKDKKSEPRTFMFLGALLLALGGIAALPLIPNAGGFSGLVDRVLYLSVGIAAGVVAGFYTLSRLSRNPLRDVKEKIDNLLGKITSPFKKKKPEPTFSGVFEISQPAHTRHAHNPAHASRQVGYFRSRRDRIIAGVASGIAERLGVSASLVRLAFILGTLFSGGAVVIAYLILAFVMPMMPNQREY
jgi:phage shock protein PspC (stress-responsive transcriptional regulator)